MNPEELIRALMGQPQYKQGRKLCELTEKERQIFDALYAQKLSITKQIEDLQLEIDRLNIENKKWWSRLRENHPETVGCDLHYDEDGSIFENVPVNRGQ
jgi:hypothetical protein